MVAIRRCAGLRAPAAVGPSLAARLGPGLALAFRGGCGGWFCGRQLCSQRGDRRHRIEREHAPALQLPVLVLLQQHRASSSKDQAGLLTQSLLPLRQRALGRCPTPFLPWRCPQDPATRSVLFEALGLCRPGAPVGFSREGRNKPTCWNHINSYQENHDLIVFEADFRPFLTQPLPLLTPSIISSPKNAPAAEPTGPAIKKPVVA